MKYKDLMTGFAAQFPSENSEEKEERGILGTAADAFDWWRNNGGAQLAFLAGAGAEGLGKLFNALGDNTTLAAKYNPSLFGALRSIGDTSDRVAQGLLKSAANIAPVADKDSYTGQLVNTLTGSFEGGLGNLAGMAGLRKTADAGYQIAQKTANDAPVSLKDGFVEYMTNPRGLAADTGQLLGSMASIVPFMGLVPEAAGARAVGALGGNALERYLIQHGMYDAAKMFAVGAPTAARYGLTSAPAEGLMEGYPVYRDLISRGYSEDDAYSRALATAGKNIPFLVASNTLEGLTLFSPLGRAAGSTWGNLLKQIGARGTINSLQEMFEEGTQEGIQNEQLGKPYSYFPPFWSDSQIDAALHVGVPAALMGAGGGAVQAIRPDVETADWQRGSDERISAADFGARAEKQSKQHQHDNLRAWADKESGGQMSDDVFNSIVRNAQAYGIPVKRAIATAIAENGGKQEGVSPAGAIGVMQLMPSTAQGLGVDPNDTEQNIRGGMKYLRQMYDQYGDWNLAHAAYNAGPSNVTDHVPQNGETEHYVARINGLLSESPSYYKDTDSPSNDSTYLGNNGKGEGRYWVRQGDYVSFDGAQPDLLNAVDILGKMFYDRTGKQLVITAGTNGDHAGGEHSHGAGWKVDIADAGANGVGMNEDGALFTADYRAQPFLKEFIAFGRSLGLGMNLEAEGTPNVHIDVALDGTQWDGNGDNAGGFSLDRVRKNTRSTTQSSEDIPTTSRTQNPPQNQQPQEEEPPKPLFDLNAEDEQTQKLLERFASERVQSLANAENPDRGTLGFFTGLFNEAGEFQNTEANRAALRERYGKDITSWANEILKQESPAQPAAPARTQSSTPRQGAPKVTNEDILATVDNFLERLRTDRTNPNTLLELQEARRAGDVAKMESILRQNNVEITPVESTAPVAPSPQPPVQSENVVQNNQPPENILTSEQETAQPQQETKPATPKTQSAQTKTELAHINRVSKATNLANKNKKALENIVNSIQWLAAQNNIVIPAEDLTKLKKRSLKTISKWRDRLTEAGALTVKPAQETTTAPPAPQQTAQPPAAETTATPKETPLQTALQRTRQILDTQRQQEEQAQRQQEEQALRERQEAAEAEVRRKSEESYRRIVQEKAERERQEAQERELENSSAIGEKYYGNQSTAPEANEADFRIARAPISTESRAARAEQGRALLRMFYSEPFRDVQLPAGLEQSLERGDTKAIETAQGLLEQRDLADRRRSDTRAGQADEQALIAQEEDIARRAAQSQHATDTAHQGLMQSTNETVQSQREAQQENVTRQEQPAQEDDRDVFDLLPESAELNDVESSERTEQRPTRETPQPAPQQVESTQETQSESQSETPAQIEPPKPKAKRSKKAAALHKKFKTDTHPNIGAYLDDLIETAASKEKSDERTNAQRELKTYETREAPTDEALDRVEKQLQEKKELRERYNLDRRGEEYESSNQPVTKTEYIYGNTPKAQELYNSAIERLKKVIDFEKYPEVKLYADRKLAWYIPKSGFIDSGVARSGVDEKVSLLIGNAEKFGEAFVAAEALKDNFGNEHFTYKSKTDNANTRRRSREADEVIEKARKGEISAEEAYRQVKEILYGKNETRPQQSKPKQKRSTSKKEEIKDKLYKKFNVDTHSHIKEWLDRLFKRAAAKEDTADRKKAIEQLKYYESLDTLSSRKLNELELDAFMQIWREDSGGDIYAPVYYMAENQVLRKYHDREINFKEALRLLEELYQLEPEFEAEFNERVKKHGEKEAKKALWEKQLKQLENQLWGEDVTSESEKTDTAGKMGTSLDAEIEKIINDAKEEAYKILEASKYPDMKRVIDSYAEIHIPNTYTIKSAKFLAEDILDKAKRVKHDGHVPEMLNRMLIDWLSGEAATGKRFISELDDKAQAKYYAAEEIIKQEKSGELTSDEAYAKLKTLLAEESTAAEETPAPEEKPAQDSKPQQTETQKENSTRTRLFGNSDKAEGTIEDSWAVILNAPVGTKIRTRNVADVSPEEYEITEHISKGKMLTLFDENGFRKNTLMLNRANVKKYFGGMWKSTNQIIYPSESPQTQSAQDTASAREEAKPESKPAGKETDEQQAIEELKAKTKAELEEILEADKYPSIQEYLDDGFKKVKYDSLESAQKILDNALEQARKIKNDSVAKFAAGQMFRNWAGTRPKANAEENGSYFIDNYSFNRKDAPIAKKALAILSKMRNNGITPEAALEKLDELLSGRAQEKLDAQRAKIRNEKESLIQETKTQLSEILDLNNHPALKEIIFKSLDQEANGSPVNSNKKLKEYCERQITTAKEIRDANEIDEYEERAKERAKERLPKKTETPKSKPQPQAEPQTEKSAEQMEDIETLARKALDEIGITQKVEGCHVADAYKGMEKHAFRIILNKGASLAANVRDVINKIANYFKAKVIHEDSPEVSYGGGVATVYTFNEHDLQAARRAFEFCFSDDLAKTEKPSTKKVDTESKPKEPKAEPPAQTHKMPEFKTKGDITEQDLLDLIDQAWDKGMRVELEDIYNNGYKKFDIKNISGTYSAMKAVFEAHQVEENSKTHNGKAPATIDDCKSIADIEAYWRAKYNSRAIFAPELNDLYLPAVKEFLKGTEDVFRLFPSFAKKITRVDAFAPFGVVARYTWSGRNINCTLSFNYSDFKSKESVEELIKKQSPQLHKNASATSIGRHEAGHALASALLRRAGYVEVLKNPLSNLSNIHDSALLYWASELLSPTKKDRLARDELNEERKKISKYAYEGNGSETVAEAIADVLTNGAKAAPLSKAIVQRIKEALVGATWREHQIISKPFSDFSRLEHKNINTATVAKWYAARVAESKKQATIDAIYEKYKEKRAKIEKLYSNDASKAESLKKSNKDFGTNYDTDAWLQGRLQRRGEKLAKLAEEQAAELRNVRDASEFRKQAEQLLYDRGLAEELAKTKSREEWEALLERRTPDEKILEQDGWSDAKINECAKDTHTANVIEQLGGKIKDGKVTFSNAADKAAFTRFMELMVDPNARYDIEGGKGTINTDTSNTVAEKDLTPAQKLLVSFGKKLGVRVVFFDNPDGRFRGVHKEGYSLLNINGNKGLGGVFWHESFHWLKNNNPELYKALVKATGITDAQRKAYLETSKRTDLQSNEEIDEEILADMMDDVAKRTGLFQSIAGKNRGLIERVIQWFKDTLNKFIDHFRNPQGKLTTAQAQALASEFGRIANQLKDPNGNQIFRYNRRTHNVELADNRERTEAELAEMTAKNAHFEAKYSVDSNNNSTKSFKQRVKNLLGVEGKNIPIHKQMKRQLEDLSDMKIAADHLPEGVQVKIDKIAKVIRTGREYDWANILPEVGNAVAEQLRITQSAEMGNYIGKFILNGAPNDTSAEAKEFAKAMRENTEMRNKVMAIRSTFDTWNNMSAEEQMIASTRYDKEIPPLKERAQKFWQYLRTELFDTQMPIHYHVAKFAKAAGLKLADSINPEIAFRNLRGMQQRAMRMVYGNELTKEALQKMYPNVDFSGWKPIAMILESIKAEPGSQRYMLFDQFIKACHFLDIHRHNDNVLMQQGKVRGEIRNLRAELDKADTKKKKAELERSIRKKEESLEALNQKIMDTPDAYTKDKCADLVSKYSDEFGEAQKDLVRYSRVLLDIWVDSGMMDRRRYHQLLEAYPNYVPLHREFDENPNLNTADSMKHMLGSTKDVKDAIAAISNNTFDYIQRTEKNKAKLLLANLANFDGVGGIFELVDGSSPNDGTIIHFYENGKRKALQCSDEDIVKAVNTMNQPTMNLFLKVLQVPALMLRATATGLSPGFIAGNFLRDPQDAFMVSKSYHAGTKMELLKDFAKSLNPFVTWSYLLHAVGAGKLLDNKYVKKFDSKTLEGYLKNFDSKMLEEYRVSGAAQSDFFSFDRDYKAEAIERLTKKNLTRYASPKGVFEFLRKAGEMTELATRLYVYDRVKTDRAKKHGGINIYDDLVTAAFESRDFIDFARHGNAGRTWNTLTAFANPVLQGFDKQWRTYDFGQLKKFGGTEETQKNFCNSVARLFLKGILPAIVLSLLHKDEDWYKDDVQDWEKENYWIITETLRVPKGADLSLRFFSNLFEHLIASDPVRADKVLQPLKGILPDLMPTAFLPIFECMANYDLFRRQPIVPQREVNKFKDTPELQYDSTNSKLAVLLGRVTGVSPRYIDHVIYGYTSGFGKEATHLIDTVTPGRHTAWTRSDVPFFSRVLRTPYRAPKIVSEYYEEFGRQESYAQRLAWEKKHGNPNAKPSTEYDPALHRRLKNIQRAMQNLNAAERAIMDDPKLTSEQVEEKREEIQKRRVELCRKAFQRAR